jgi:hypothetical protein
VARLTNVKNMFSEHQNRRIGVTSDQQLADRKAEGFSEHGNRHFFSPAC